MRQAYAQIGAGVHDAAEHEGGERDRAVGEVAYRIRQMIARRARRHRRRPALMYENERPQRLRSLPKRQEFRLVERPPVHVIANHRPLQPQLGYAPLQLRYGGGDVLHGQSRQPRESVGTVGRQPRRVIVAVPRHVRRRFRVLVVIVQDGVGGQNLNVHPQRIHVRQPLIRRPNRSRIMPMRRRRMGRDPVPILPRLHSVYERLGRYVGVYVYNAHFLQASAGR